MHAMRAINDGKWNLKKKTNFFWRCTNFLASASSNKTLLNVSNAFQMSMKYFTGVGRNHGFAMRNTVVVLQWFYTFYRKCEQGSYFCKWKSEMSIPPKWQILRPLNGYRTNILHFEHLAHFQFVGRFVCLVCLCTKYEIPNYELKFCLMCENMRLYAIHMVKKMKISWGLLHTHTHST